MLARKESADADLLHRLPLGGAPRAPCSNCNLRELEDLSARATGDAGIAYGVVDDTSDGVITLVVDVELEAHDPACAQCHFRLAPFPHPGSPVTRRERREFDPNIRAG